MLVVTLTPMASDTETLPSLTPMPNIIPSVAMSVAAQLPDTPISPLPTPPSGSGQAVPKVTDATPLHGKLALHGCVTLTQATGASIAAAVIDAEWPIDEPATSATSMPDRSASLEPKQPTQAR